jgi:cytochrome-b5 reductase
VIIKIVGQLKPPTLLPSRCVQVADAILANPADKTKVTLLFANVSEGDILLKDKIDAMAAAHPDKFKVHYVVDKPR